MQQPAFSSFARSSSEFHTRYYKVAGITIRLDSELAIGDRTFAEKFRLFEVGGPGDDNIHLIHRFWLPDMDRHFGKVVYCRSPWVIHENGAQWVYVLETSPDPRQKRVRQISFINAEHTRAEIYNGELIQSEYRRGGLGALTMAPTDQILLARLLADRQGFYLHSDGMNMDGRGFLFAGKSGAGKSTIARMLRDKAEILCDDRMIVRKWADGWRIHGNWSHGSMPVVSAGAAPLKAIFFLEKADENRMIPIANRIDIISRLFGCLIKPMATVDWWNKMLTLIEELARTIPCYRLRFDRSGGVYEQLRQLL